MSDHPTPAQIERQQLTTAILEDILIRGDLSKLSAADLLAFNDALCRSLRLNPLSSPIGYYTIGGRKIPYAKKDCSDQLRHRDKISVKLGDRVLKDEIYTVEAFASDPSGRTDEDLGAVALPNALKGQPRADKMLHCVTKAKRRVTLSFSGLGLPDETELQDLAASERERIKNGHPKDENGDIKPPENEGTLDLHSKARKAAREGGAEGLRALWKETPEDQRDLLELWKPELLELYPKVA